MSSGLLAIALTVALGNGILASSALPLDTNKASASDLPVGDVQTTLGPIAQAATSLIDTACLLASPTDKGQIEKCVQTLCKTLNLPAIAEAKHAGPVHMAFWLSPDNVRDISQLSEVKGVEINSLTRLLTLQLDQLLGTLLNVEQAANEIKQVQNMLALNVVQAPGLKKDEVVDMLMNNDILNEKVPGLPQAPSVPQAPGLPGVPQMPTVPQVPGVPQVPMMPGVPQVPMMPMMPQVPGVPQAPQVPMMPTVPQFQTMMPTVPQMPAMMPTAPQVPNFGGASAEQMAQIMQILAQARA